jgi:hypothetical protein
MGVRLNEDLPDLPEFVRRKTRAPSVRAAMEETRGAISEEGFEILLV